jgi:NitT/TauT family transport system substrate-binding protein
MKRSTVLAGFAAAGIAGALPFRARAAEVLRIATIPIDAGAEAWYAQAQGFFQKAGIDPQVQAIANGSAITAAVVSGAVDIGFSNMLSLATAHERGVPITAIAPASLYLSSAPTSVLMVPKDSPVKSARDLNGKTVAVNGLKNITQVAVEAWVDKNGGDSKTLRFVEMAFPDMPLALSSHRVDAALVAEPAVVEAKRDARVLGKAYDGIAREFLIGAWFTSQSWANAHGDLVKRIAQVMRETAAWANKNDAGTAAVLARSTKISPVTLRAMTRARYAERLETSQIQPTIDVAAKYGVLRASFAAAALIDRNATA